MSTVASFLCRLGELPSNHNKCDGYSYGPSLTDPAKVCTCKCHGPKDGDSHD